MTPAQPLSQAHAMIAAGRIDDAAALLEHHLKTRSGDVESLRLLARILASLGDVQGARRRLDAAARIIPDNPELAFERGTVALMLDDPGGAVVHFQTAVQQAPEHGGAWFNLGWALRRSDQMTAAVQALQQAVRLAPTWQAWFNLGNALMDSGRYCEAVAPLETALGLSPGDAGIRINLGMALWRSGALFEAEAHLRAAAVVTPDSAAPAILGNLLTAMDRIDEAVAVFRHGLTIRPTDGGLLLNLGLALAQGKDYTAAETAFRQLVEAEPDMAEAWNALGSLALRRERLDEARKAFQRALALRPGMAEALNNLGNVAATSGDVAEALNRYRQAHQAAPQDATIHSNLLFHLTHMSGQDPAEVFAEHRRYGEIQEALAPLLPLSVPPLADGGRLRVGYVSPDFCNHAVSFWFEAVLANHDPDRFEIVCYHTGPRQDEVTDRLRRLVPLWRSVHGVSADGLAAKIRADAIHILVDLAGHTAHNALPAFARKPAPIQAAYLGYPNTTGLTRIDYRLAHTSTILPLEYGRYTEKLVPMQRSAVFRPPAYAPALSSLPMVTNGNPRFGSFNKPQKIGPPVYDVWAELLRQESRATLLMVVPGGDDPVWNRHYRDLFEARGIDGTRIDTVGLRDLPDFLHLLAQVDVALDPFPYGGGTTTLLALWMGVPVICMYGEGPADGVSAGSMYNVGLSHLVAGNADGYLATARHAVSDPTVLAAIRADLRRRLSETMVMQEREFVAELEQCYLDWWRRYVRESDA